MFAGQVAQMPTYASTHIPDELDRMNGKRLQVRPPTAAVDFEF